MRNKKYDNRDDYKPPKDQRLKTDPPPETPDKCFKCDSYNHKPKDCWHDQPFLITAHPDINTNPKLQWKNSPAGIKYMKVFPKASYLYRKCPSTNTEWRRVESHPRDTTSVYTNRSTDHQPPRRGRGGREGGGGRGGRGGGRRDERHQYKDTDDKDQKTDKEGKHIEVI